MHTSKIGDNSFLSASILVTSISSKVPLLKLTKEATKKVDAELKLIGGDCRKDCVGKYFVDEFWKMPKTSDLNIEEVIQFAKVNKVIGIIPTRDGELSFWSSNRERLREQGINVMVSPNEALSIFLDKLKLFHYGKSNNLNVIPTSENIKDIKADSYVVKERYGAGSKNVLINVDYKKASNYAKNLNHPIFQPYIVGEEYSVDVYVSITGKIMGIIPRKRELVVNGESQITTTIHDGEIIAGTKEIFYLTKVYGHQVLQFIKDENKKYWLLECNCRYGGASAVSNKCGLKTFYWFILESVGENIDKKFFPKKIKKLKQVRYPSDFYL